MKCFVSPALDMHDMDCSDSFFRREKGHVVKRDKSDPFHWNVNSFLCFPFNKTTVYFGVCNTHCELDIWIECLKAVCAFAYAIRTIECRRILTTAYRNCYHVSKKV